MCFKRVNSIVVDYISILKIKALILSTQEVEMGGLRFEASPGES
jgi:hypothetical protein